MAMAIQPRNPPHLIHFEARNACRALIAVNCTFATHFSTSIYEKPHFFLLPASSKLGGVPYLNQHKPKTGFRPTRHLENGERACVHVVIRRERKEEERRGAKTMTDMSCSAAAIWTQMLFRSSNVPAVGMMRDSLLSRMTHAVQGCLRVMCALLSL